MWGFSMSGFRIIALSLIFPSPSLQGVFFPEPQATNRGTGAVLTWGQTVNGRLQFGGEIGNNHLDVPTALTQLPISEVTVSQVIITSIAAGGAHTLLSTSEGDVYSAGANLHGQLGVGDLFDRSQLTLVSILRHAPGALYNGTQYVKSMGKQNVIKVAAGPEQSAALTNLGKLFAWGNNVYGQLGLGCGIIPQAGLLNSWDDITNPEVDSSLGANQLPSSNPASNRPVGTQTLINCRPYRRRREPVLVEEMAKTYVDSVVMGRRHTAALTGQCGADKFADGSCRPELVTSVVGGRVSNKLVLGFIRGSPAGAGPEQVLSDAGVDICTCGQVWMWGNNDYGQLGSGDLLSRYSPSLVTALSDAGIHIVSVSVGELHTVALSIKGNVYTWGYNANGQLGTWDTVHQALPVRVKKPDPGFLFVTSVR